jgi:hypothetical protein
MRQAIAGIRQAMRRDVRGAQHAMPLAQLLRSEGPRDDDG